MDCFKTKTYTIMQNETAITTSTKVNPMAELKQELKRLIGDFPKRYGYAKKIVERLNEKGHIIEETNVFNVIHSKTYYDKLIVNEIQTLHDDYTTEMSTTLNNLKAKKAHAGSDHNA